MSEKEINNKKNEEFLEIFVKKGEKLLDDEEIDDLFLEKNLVEIIPFQCQFLNQKQQKDKKDKASENQEENSEKIQENNQNEEIKEKQLNSHKGIIQVNKKDQLLEMIKQILINAHQQKQNVIGVDTEQSFQNTYTPFLTLIQISTYDADYVIDCLEIEKQWILYLKYIFQNRNIVKVFYAGQNDLVWLKRDYDLQIYNYCDVKILADYVWRNKNNSLVSLLESICEFSISAEQKKKLQLSNWEERPLSPEQLEYAALDAHYLIFIRFYLIKELLETDGIDYVVDELYEMQKTILKEYQPKEFSDKQYLALCFKLIKLNKPYQTLPAEILGQGKLFTIELARLRDQICKENNLNTEQQMNDQIMLAVVQNLFFQEKNNEKNIQEFEKTKNTIEENLFYKKYEKQIWELKEAIQHTQKEKYQKILQKLDKKEKSLRKNQESDLMKQQKKEKNMTASALKSEPYQNCQLQAPSGLVLCNCNRKKIEWYKNNGLGVIVSENPLTLRLNFQPNGQSNEQLKMEVDSEDGYYTTHRENKCVVCGDKENFVKFHIVPPLYRTHFPNEFKSHRSHDILLLCLRCHQICSQQWDIKKREIADRYQIELHSINKENTLLKKIQYISNTAQAYLKFKEKMMKEQKQSSKENIRETYLYLSQQPILTDVVKFLDENEIKRNKNNKIKIDDKVLLFLVNLKDHLKKIQEKKPSQNEKNSHGRQVVTQMDQDQLIEFIKEWRQYFLDSMNPRFLPPAWNVNHKFQRGFGHHSVFNEKYDQENSEKKQITQSEQVKEQNGVEQISDQKLQQ